jgi:flagellar basal body-associated protein FliL
MNKKMLIVIIVIAIIIISFGVYAILPYFTNTVVDEPLPTASGEIMETGAISYNASTKKNWIDP